MPSSLTFPAVWLSSRVVSNTHSFDELCLGFWDGVILSTFVAAVQPALQLLATSPRWEVMTLFSAILQFFTCQMTSMFTGMVKSAIYVKNRSLRRSHQPVVFDCWCRHYKHARHSRLGLGSIVRRLDCVTSSYNVFIQCWKRETRSRLMWRIWRCC